LKPYPFLFFLFLALFATLHVLESLSHHIVTF